MKGCDEFERKMMSDMSFCVSCKQINELTLPDYVQVPPEYRLNRQYMKGYRDSFNLALETLDQENLEVTVEPLLKHYQVFNEEVKKALAKTIATDEEYLLFGQCVAKRDAAQLKYNSALDKSVKA